MEKLKIEFILFIEKIQSPDTQMGKSSRDGLFTGLAWVAVSFLESFNNIDFGGANFIIAGIVGLLIAKLNREVRSIKKEF